MTILHTINEEHGIVLSSLVGAIADADLLPSYKQLYENKRWKPGFHEIVDLRDAQMDGVTGEGLRRLSSLVEGYIAGKCDGFKTAVIAPEDLPYGLARLYEAVSEESPENVMVFRDLNQALEWIGVDDSILE